MKKFLGNLACIILVIFVLFGTAISLQSDQWYANGVNEFVKEKFAAPGATDSWRDGVKSDYDMELVRLDYKVAILGVKHTEQGETIVAIELTITGSCTKNGNKFRIVSRSNWAYLFSTKDEIINHVCFGMDENIILDGWYGTSI